jgi:hypothetical protein
MSETKQETRTTSQEISKKANGALSVISFAEDADKRFRKFRS